MMIDGGRTMTKVARYGVRGEMTAAHVARFWKRVNKTETCWLWTGALCRGYGVVQIGRRKQGRAHRFAWVLLRGDVPKGMNLCHRCDVRHCCNPDHIFIGTQKDNLADMDAKGRTRGPRAHEGKLTMEQARSVRRRRAEGAKWKDLMREFNISQGTVWYILSGNRYREVA